MSPQPWTYGDLALIPEWREAHGAYASGKGSASEKFMRRSLAIQRMYQIEMAVDEGKYDDFLADRRAIARLAQQIGRYTPEEMRDIDQLARKIDHRRKAEGAA